MNNKLVVYYSLDGNTKNIAQQIKENLECDMIQIKPKKDLNTNKSKLYKYFWGGKQVITNKLPELEEYTIDLNKYNTIFIGTPIWAGRISPPIKSFLSENSIENKDIYLFCCHGGGSTKKAIEEYRSILEENNKIISIIDFKDPLKNDNAINVRKLKNWINGIVK